MERPNHLYDRNRLPTSYLLAVRFMSINVRFHVSHTIANFVLRFVIQLFVFLSLFLTTVVQHVGFSLLSTHNTAVISSYYESLVVFPPTPESARALISLLQYTARGLQIQTTQRETKPL